MAKSNISIETAGGAVLGGYFWYITTHDNWLCKMNIQNYTVEYVGIVPYADTDSYSYVVAAGLGNNIFIIPEFGDFFLEYDINKNTFVRYELIYSKLIKGKNGGKAVKFRSGIIRNDRLWILPVSAHCIIEFNIKERKLIEHIEWFSLLDEYDDDEILFGAGTISKDKLWLPCIQENSIIEFSMEDKKAFKHRVGNEQARFSVSAYYEKEDCLYIADYIDGLLYKWKPVENICNKIVLNIPGYEIETDSKGREQRITAIWCLYIYKNYLLVIPSTSNKFILMDLEKQEIIKIYDKEKGTSFKMFCVFDEKRILMTSHKKGRMLIFHKETHGLEKIKTEFHMAYENYPNKNFYRESHIGVEEFIKGILRVESVSINHSENCIGKIICENLLSNREE